MFPQDREEGEKLWVSPHGTETEKRGEGPGRPPGGFRVNGPALPMEPWRSLSPDKASEC